MNATCYRMAQLAQLAYEDSAPAKKQSKAMGYTGHKVYEEDGAQGHLFWDKEVIVLAFRGTEPDELSDVLADLNAIPRGAMTYGWVHSGFRGELDKLWDAVVDCLNNHKEKKLYITGHSLGAAMATLCTSRVEERRKVEQLTTFGSPRVGTRSFVKNISTPHMRFVNNNDIVTKVPLALMGYKHHGELKYINFYGNIRDLTMWQAIKDKWRGYKSGLLDGAMDHGMENYVKCLEQYK